MGKNVMLDDLLEYHQAPEDSAFVTEVMDGVKRQQRLRRLILTATGITGALFGATGAMMLARPLAQAMTEVNLLPILVAAVGGIVFLFWVFQDETSASG